MADEQEFDDQGVEGGQTEEAVGAGEGEDELGEPSGAERLLDTANLDDVTGLSAKDNEEIFGTGGTESERTDVDDLFDIPPEVVMGRAKTGPKPRRVRIVRPERRSSSPPTSLGGMTI